MAERAPMPMCPMAKMCRGMMERRTSRFALIAPGVLLIVLGITLLIEPRILVWFVSLAFIVMGSAMLAITKIMRSAGERFRSTDG